MTESKSTQKPRKPRNDCPLKLHNRKVWYKKIRGKFYYFGRDLEQALTSYYELMAELGGSKVVQSCTGDKPADNPQDSAVTVNTLVNMFLQDQDARVKCREISSGHWYDQKRRLTTFAAEIGPDRPVSSVTTLELKEYRVAQITKGLKRNSINNNIAAVTALIHWAQDAEVPCQLPNVRALKKVAPPKCPERDEQGAPTEESRYLFRPEEVGKLLEHADVQFRAMIWLALNCGFGPKDISNLHWSDLDLNQRAYLPRSKTGVNRQPRLWPRTVEALRQVPRRGPRVFYTKHGNPWVRSDPKSRRPINSLTKMFAVLIQRTGLEVPEGTNFYSLRRQVATESAKTGNHYAVQGILGHKDTRMADTYIQEVNEQTDLAVDKMEQWAQQIPDPATPPVSPR
jgi:integrase